MCKKLIVVLTMSFCLISSVGAGTVTWDFENGEDHNFTFYSTYPAVAGLDDPNTAGDEKITGMVGISRLPDAGIAWTVGPPNQFDGLKPAADVENARVDANGLLDYSLGAERIATESGTLNTYNLNQHGDYIHTQENDQIASSPIVVLDANAVLTVWSLGGGSGTHAPEYDPDVAMWYTDGSSGIAVISFEEDDKYAILATLHLNGKGTLTEDTLDLSAFAGRRVFLDVVDAFEGSWGWLAVDEIQITNATSKTAGFICQLTDGELVWGLDQAQVDHLTLLGYDVKVIDYQDIGSEVFTMDDANALDVMIISESPNSNACDNLIGMTVPLMHQEAFAWDNYSFMGVRTNIRWLAEQTQVEIVNDTHPIMVDAGFSVGKLPWFTAPDQYTTEDVNMMAPGAELLIKADTEEAAVVFVMEKGAELADGNSVPNNVVCFSIPGNQDGLNQVNGIIDASIMSDEQWALYDAALRWLNPPPVEIPPMVAHWSMDDGAGTVVTDSAGSNDGEIVGNVTWIADGALDGAVSYDVTDPNAAILVPHAAELDFGDVDFSISLMVRYPTVPGDAEHQLILKGSFGGDTESGSRYVLFNKSGRYRFEIDNGPADVKSGGLSIDNTPVVTGEWVHVVVVRDSVNDLLSMYINGAVPEGGTSTDVSGDISSGEDLYIGNSMRSGATSEADIDDVRIFDVALTEDEIAAIY